MQTSLQIPPISTVFFCQIDNQNIEIIKICENGDIFVKGKLVENDKDVTNALREFLTHQGLLK